MSQDDVFAAGATGETLDFAGSVAAWAIGMSFGEMENLCESFSDVS